MKQEETMQQITKIVITGGPCAGKTTGMSWIQNAFTKWGYRVLLRQQSGLSEMPDAAAAGKGKSF